MIADLLSYCHLKTAYSIGVDDSAERGHPYFAHGECNFAFEIESNQVLYLHLGASD